MSHLGKFPLLVFYFWAIEFRILKSSQFYLFASQIMPPRRSDARGNFSVPPKYNMDKARHSYRVQTRSRVHSSDWPREFHRSLLVLLGIMVLIPLFLRGICLMLSFASQFICLLSWLAPNHTSLSVLFLSLFLLRP